jgi:cytochrome c oxidase subunit 2
VAIAGGLSLVVLIGLLFQSVATGRAIDTLRSPDALRIQVTGNQWWWDVQYAHEIPSLRVTTANEIHIPVGRAVRFDLLSTDVIHSLWIPNLQGKIDLVPGRLNELWLRADQPGVYRGQCAEYCGLQHAKMALVVVAEPPADFERWLTGNRAPAAAPVTAEQQRGRDIVERGPCAMCHNITGTLAGGRTAPDLTHIASRSTLAAGTLPNTRGHLAGWIADPQGIKPGNRMPAPGLSSDELQAVLAYLETLK